MEEEIEMTELFIEKEPLVNADAPSTNTGTRTTYDEYLEKVFHRHSGSTPAV
jgi:hypothetical protein